MNKSSLKTKIVFSFQWKFFSSLSSERHNNNDVEEGGEENDNTNKTSEAFSHVRIASIIPKAKRHV